MEVTKVGCGMARSVRLNVMVEPALADQIKELAEGMNMSVSSLLNLLLTIAVSSTGQTFAQFGATLEGLMSADAEHDAP